jgi:choline transporter-like protein 2/4/5
MMMDRICTDVICCVLFVIFCVGMIGISGYALAAGDPLKLLTPFDSDGNRCGMKNQIAT